MTATPAAKSTALFFQSGGSDKESPCAFNSLTN